MPTRVVEDAYIHMRAEGVVVLGHTGARHKLCVAFRLYFLLVLGQCPCVATGTYNISITYICTYVLYSYEIEDDIYASCPG
jgi:hypothetical protein